MITRRAMLPAPIALAAAGSVKAAEAALPLRVVATADGPYVSRIIDLGTEPYHQPQAPRRPLAEHNRDRYVLEIG